MTPDLPAVLESSLPAFAFQHLFSSPTPDLKPFFSLCLRNLFSLLYLCISDKVSELMFDSLLIEFSVFLLILKISFCILERSLYQMCVLQIFSPVSYLLIPLIVSFAGQKCLILAGNSGT